MKIMSCQDFHVLSCFKKRMQHEFNALVSNPIPEARHVARIRRQCVLEIFKSGKVLPVWIFQKALKYRLIAQVKRVFQIIQSHHQTDRFSGPAHGVMIGAGEFFFKDGPVNLIGHLKERMLVIQQLIKSGSEHIGCFMTFFRSHKSPVF